MIRSPISAEERLSNRVSTLEKEMTDFRKAADIIYALLCVTGDGLLETAKRVDDLYASTAVEDLEERVAGHAGEIDAIHQDLDYHETHIDNLIAAIGVA